MRRITAVDLSLPDTWLRWQPGGGSAEARRVADDIGACSLAMARSRQVVLDTDRSLAIGLPYLCVAAWAPPGDPPAVLGTLVAEILVSTSRESDPAGRHLIRTRHLVRRTAADVSPTRVRYRDTRLDTIAGIPAVLTRRTVPAGMRVGISGSGAAPLAGRTREELVCTLFPAGAVDGVELRLSAEDDAGLVRLAEQAAGLAEGMRVRLGAEVTAEPRRRTRRGDGPAAESPGGDGGDRPGSGRGGAGLGKALRAGRGRARG